MTRKDNVAAKMLQVLGVIIIVAYTFRALAIVDEFNGGTAFEVFLQGLIFGMLLIGFGEVIRLMQGLFNQREPFRPVEDGETERRAALAKTGERTVSLETRNRIMDYYAKQNMIVDDIEATPYDSYFIVHRDDERDIVDLNNWEVEILTENQLRSQPELRGLIE
ncbi:hypothetical protein [Planococcus sp. CAU13]|uniref:hypothetical protein n=1 Tax=Planococcus sp. CAU13 TaxID=1541197 RepID=UPI00053006CE|nr:hypothetical protein [Planococcus sp. CAU13]